jgi:hypothetical protein
MDPLSRSSSQFCLCLLFHSYLYELDVKYRIQIIQFKKSRKVGRTSTAQHGMFPHQLYILMSIIFIGRDAVGAKPSSLF